LIHQNLAGKPIALSGNLTASHGTPFARHKNLRASTGTPFAKAGEPLASHGNADIRLGKGVAELDNLRPLILPVKLLERDGGIPKGLCKNLLGA